MKVRSDFVTNSSSSSFIIGKKDDTSATIENVFQIVKNLYKEFLSIRDVALEYVSLNPNTGIQYVEENGCGHFTAASISDYNKRRGIMDAFERNFNVSIFERYATNYEWLNCNTYLEYQDYWLNKMANTDWRVHAPFTIADFLEEKEIEWLHYHFDPEYDTKIHAVNSTSDVLSWYFPYIEEAFAYTGGCDNCRCVEWCDKEECQEARFSIIDKKIPEDKACLYMLGRVCIHSECGYMPNYVVDKLRNISEYSCNHMG